MTMERHVPVSFLFDAFKLLTTPSAVASPDKQNNFPENEELPRFDQCVEHNIDLLTTSLQKNHKYHQLSILLGSSVNNYKGRYKSTRWKLVTYSLSLLDIFRQSMQKEVSIFKTQQEKKESNHGSKGAPPLSPDVLSVSHQKMLLTVIQFIVCFGIYPNLQAGVGVPIAKRSDFGPLIEQQTTELVSDSEKEYRVALCTQILLDCLKQTSLGSLILSRHLGDILAALSQICFKPKPNQGNINVVTSNYQEEKEKKIDFSKHSISDRNLKIPEASQPFKSSYEHVDDSSGTITIAEMGQASPADVINSVSLKLCQAELGKTNNVSVRHQEDVADKKYFRGKLSDLLDQVYQPLIVRELLILQGRPGKQSGSDDVHVEHLLQAPIWLRNACGRMLTDRLIKPNGVQNVIRGMMEGAGGNADSDWKKCEAIAKIIAHCPRHVKLEVYYAMIGPQVLDLLNMKDKQLARYFLRIACRCISTMLSQQPELTRKHIIHLLMKPLLMCSSDNSYAVTEHIFVAVEENELTVCIDNLLKVMVEGSEPNNCVILELKPVIIVLFLLLIFTKGGVSHLRNSCEQIILKYLKAVDHRTCLDSLYLMTFAGVGNNEDRAYHSMDSALQFSSGPTGGVIVTSKNGERNSLLELSQLELASSCVLALLVELTDDKITADFFLCILEDLTEVISSGTRMYAESVDCAATLLQRSEPSDSDVFIFQKNLATLTMLGNMCETLGPTCLKSTGHILQFIKVTLGRGVQILKRSNDEMFTLFESETLTMAMGLLTAVMEGEIEIHESSHKVLQELLPLLADICCHHPDQGIQEMASDLRLAIATRGAVRTENNKSSAEILKHFSEQMSSNRKNTCTCSVDDLQEYTKTPMRKGKTVDNLDEKSKVSDRSLVETSEDMNKIKCQRCHQFQQPEGIENGIRENVKNSNFQQALKEMSDPMIPVQGHALLAIGHLLQQKDKEALAQSEQLLGLFFEKLEHQDSYIYLAAIRGLGALTDCFPDQVLPALTKEFLIQPDEKDKKVKHSSELRMKIGEVLMRATRNLGDLIPKYGDLLLNTTLRGARDADPFIRASSISNVAEICRLLRFSLGKVIQEVFECCSSLLTSDLDVEVRRAASHALFQLLCDLHSDNIKIMESIITNLYRLLKRTHTIEKDDVVQLHIQMALDELDRITRDLLFPKETFTKKIRILDNS